MDSHSIPATDKVKCQGYGDYGGMIGVSADNGKENLETTLGLGVPYSQCNP